MFELLVPDAEQVRLDTMFVLEGSAQIVLELTANTGASACPLCHQRSTKVHSRYHRHLTDLPWADLPVSISLSVRRFFCPNAHCPRAIFCERLPGVVAPWARRTERLAAVQQAIGLALGGAAGARLTVALKMKAGIDLLLCLVRRRERPDPPAPRVLGVDDWAKRKGQDYGTILVDLERGEIVDLLADRTAETLIAWLKAHPGIEIVARDRSQTYAEAIQQGAPEAIQVADRWHLLKNLADAVFKLLQQGQGTIRKQLASITEQTAVNNGPPELPKAVRSPGLELLTQAEQRRKERMGLARQLHSQGWTQKSIAHHLNVDRKTVRRYLHAATPVVRRPRSGQRLVDPFKAYLLKRWNEGCYNAAQLYREIQRQGYAGKVTVVRDFVQQLRQASGLPPKVRSGNGHLLSGDPTKQPPSLRVR
ncbi:MAG: ISL3 family transposase [Anaerolineae bacterium]|nr:ISL3 family transposase [Anaerolineae bacterium]